MINYNSKDIKTKHFLKLDSTSSFLKREYKSLEDLTFISASYQENGRGRLGRTWTSLENENLMFSVLIKNKELINKFDSLSLISAVAIYKTLNKIGLKNIKIKWPNDVYVNNKKISGILLEGVTEENEFNSLIIGIGLNINQKDFNGLNATSIFLELNKEYSIDEIKEILYSELINSLNEILNNDNSYLKVIKNNDYLKNKYAYVLIDNKEKYVKILGVLDDNKILVLDDNKEISLNTGEISILKKDLYKA